MTISGIFKKFMGTENERLARAFKEKFGKGGEAQLTAFVTSPLVHGEFTKGKVEPGYFGGQPYAAAFGMYFIRSALHPDRAEENFRMLVSDIDKNSEIIYEGNPTKSITDRLQIYKPNWNVGFDLYPVRQYVENIVNPHLTALGVSVDRQAKHDYFPTFMKEQN